MQNVYQPGQEYAKQLLSNDAQQRFILFIEHKSINMEYFA